jgi:hypothetical protein
MTNERGAPEYSTKNLVVLSRYKHTQLSTTKDFNNSIYILPKRNFDVRTETEFRCLSLEAKLLSAHENYTTKQVNSGVYQDGK